MADNIKIFVSHRIDIDSETISNDIYYPIRCGAVFDDNRFTEIPGDNTGDNISEKRMKYCEFTVQYWAWKNEVSDYYGLCHYRRYLSFAQKKYKTNMYNMVLEPLLSPISIKKYRFNNVREINDIVLQYDVVVSESAKVCDIYTPLGYKNTVYEMWAAHEAFFFEHGVIELMFELIKQLKPEYYMSAKEYFSGDRHRGFNCYILKKELFNELCEFQFAIMDEVDKRLDYSQYSQTMKRTPAFVGEMLYGIFIYHLSKDITIKMGERQLVFFERTEKIDNKYYYYFIFILSGFEKILRRIVDPLFPIGSSRRELIKDILFTILPIKKRGMATVNEKKSNDKVNS